MSVSQTVIKNIADLVVQDCMGKLDSIGEWGLRVMVNDDNLCYLAFNRNSKEALWLDPVKEDWELLLQVSKEFSEFRFLGVIETHTHADHLSCAGELANALNIPLMMHFHAPSTRVHLRVSQDTALPTASGPLRFLMAPGHTWDGLVMSWGPFSFTGDTILYGDTGRNDLPTGNASQHYETLQKLKKILTDGDWILPGHDLKGGQISTWKHQLEINPSLRQNRDEFMNDAGAYVGPSPKKLKESLFYNFK
jgi:glyoxylase-like metal-dependent hydrolase (beta-lactamase superfamily II)